MVVALMTWELHIDGCHSLKEKRRVVKSLKDRLHNRFNVSVAETAHHELWQRAELSCCVVSRDRKHAESILMSASQVVERHREARVIDSVRSFL